MKSFSLLNTISRTVLLASLAVATNSFAAVPNNIQDGDTLTSDKLMGNFNALDNDVGAIDSTVQSLISRIETLEANSKEWPKALAYAWVRSDGDVVGGSSNFSYTYNSHGPNSEAPGTTAAGYLSGFKSSTGSYTITFNRLPVGGDGHVQVTAYGPGASYCKVENWNDRDGVNGKILEIKVLCFDGAGAAADSAFTVMFIK